MIHIEIPWLSPHAFAPNPSNPMESEMLPIDQVFRPAQVVTQFAVALVAPAGAYESACGELGAESAAYFIQPFGS